MAVVNQGTHGRRRRLPLHLLSPFLLPLICLLCVWHPCAAHAWVDLDVFSAGCLALAVLVSLGEMALNRGIFGNRTALREATGIRYDRATIRWSIVIAVSEPIVFLDYAHWHLLPALRIIPLQVVGMALYALGYTLLIWTDTRLARHLRSDPENRGLITTGPFSVVRHPRYASLVLVKLGFSLLMASPIAWLLLLASIVLIRRRLAREEFYLLQHFGPDYVIYAGRTRRLVPGIY